MKYTTSTVFRIIYNACSMLEMYYKHYHYHFKAYSVQRYWIQLNGDISSVTPYVIFHRCEASGISPQISSRVSSGISLGSPEVPSGVLAEGIFQKILTQIPLGTFTWMSAGFPPENFLRIPSLVSFGIYPRIPLGLPSEVLARIS